LNEIDFDVQSNPLSQLNLPHGTKLKNWKSEKLRSKKRLCSEVSVNSRESVESVLKKKRKGCGGKDLQKRKVSAWNERVRGDE